MSIRLLLTAALLGVTVSACKKKEAAPVAETPPPPPPAPAAASVSALELGKRVGPNRRVVDTTGVFSVRDTFHLAVVTENTAAGAVLSAKWSFQTGQVVDSTMQPVAAPDAASPVSVTAFMLSKKGAWPAGRYKVEVWLDGTSKGVRDFEVRR